MLASLTSEALSASVFRFSLDTSAVAVSALFSTDSSVSGIASITSSIIGSSESFAPSLIDGVTLTNEPIDPGTAPFTNKTFSFKSIFSISRFCTVVFLSPMCPAIFFPLKTLPGN